MTPELALYTAIGFLAQMVDGVLGLGYGVVATTSLLGVGLTPLQASAGVHLAEVVTTGATGLFHMRRGHVQWSVVRPLIIGGGIGGVAGVSLLALASPLAMDLISNGVAIYLAIMGFLLLLRAIRQRRQPSPLRQPVLLGFVGGFFDSSGGGGWGSIVASRMMLTGVEPRVAVGSSIAAEFAVTVVISIAFVGLASARPGVVVAGLILGGLIAAPIAPFLAGRLPSRVLLGLVGAVVMILSLRVMIG